MLLVLSLALNIAAGYQLRSELREVVEVLVGSSWFGVAENKESSSHTTHTHLCTQTGVRMTRGEGGDRRRANGYEERGRLIKRGGTRGEEGFVELHVVGQGNGSMEIDHDRGDEAEGEEEIEIELVDEEEL